MAASGFQKPSLSFKDASLSDVTLGGATVNLIFTVTNPNDASLSLAETDYKLSLEGKQVVAGKPPAGIKIPAKGSSDVTLPASVKFADIAGSIADFLRKEQANYRAEGHIGVDTPIGIAALPFEKEGTVPLPKLPDVSLGTPKIGSLSLTSARIDVPLVFANQNPFALPLGSVSGALRIAGADVGEVGAQPVGRVDAKGAKTVTLPVLSGDGGGACHPRRARPRRRRRPARLGGRLVALPRRARSRVRAGRLAIDGGPGVVQKRPALACDRETAALDRGPQHMAEPELSFFARLWLALVCLFRIVFDPPFAALVAQAREQKALPAPAAPSGEPVRAAPDAALHLLAQLQREGRFIDFCEEEIASFSDAEVGAAARTVHGGCRKVLRAAVILQPVRTDAEGTEVTVAEGFDPASSAGRCATTAGRPPR